MPLPPSFKAPIIEAIFDIDCAMSPSFSLEAIGEVSKTTVLEKYPTQKLQFLNEQVCVIEPGKEPKMTVNNTLHAYQYVSADGRQLVQYRRSGFSFNRLAPYSRYEDYSDEFNRTWLEYLEIAKPAQLQALKMRYINRILLPLDASTGGLDFAKYLQICPQLPKTPKTLKFNGFLHQHTATEVETGHSATIIIANQAPEDEKLPIIFDITVVCKGPREPGDSSWIAAEIASLRSLKNSIFENTLTESCLNLCQ